MTQAPTDRTKNGSHLREKCHLHKPCLKLQKPLQISPDSSAARGQSGLSHDLGRQLPGSVSAEPGNGPATVRSDPSPASHRTAREACPGLSFKISGRTSVDSCLTVTCREASASQETGNGSLGFVLRPPMSGEWFPPRVTRVTSHTASQSPFPFPSPLPVSHNFRPHSVTLN